MFDQAQIQVCVCVRTLESTCRMNSRAMQEFKEAFNMIDQNRDGVIDRDDLRDMFASLGKEVTEEYLQGMIEETPTPVTFPVFLSMFGEKLNGTDPEEIIKNAFQCFDPENNGHLHEDQLRELLTTMGDRYALLLLSLVLTLLRDAGTLTKR